jgi:hypothetical protein
MFFLSTQQVLRLMSETQAQVWNENVIYYEMMESYAYNKHIITYIQAYMIIVNNQHK